MGGKPRRDRDDAPMGWHAITAKQLGWYAGKHTGPRHYRNGKIALYTPEDLAAWVKARIRPADGKAPSKAA